MYSGHETVSCSKCCIEETEGDWVICRIKRQRNDDSYLQVSLALYPQRRASTNLRIYSRSGDVVEQIMKPQWWISCKPMAQEALRVSFPCILHSLRSLFEHSPGTYLEHTEEDLRWSARLLIIFLSVQPLESSRSNPRLRLRNGSDGWRIFRIGVSHDNFGGVIDVLLGC